MLIIFDIAAEQRAACPAAGDPQVFPQ